MQSKLSSSVHSPAHSADSRSYKKKRELSRSVRHVYRIIKAIGKHIIAQHALSGAGVGIGIDESAQLGIVITGLEIVERGLSVLGLTARQFC